MGKAYIVTGVGAGLGRANGIGLAQLGVDTGVNYDRSEEDRRFRGTCTWNVLTESCIVIEWAVTNGAVGLSMDWINQRPQ